MTRKAKTVLGFCPTLADAEEAVDRLRLCGFRNTDVSALIPESALFLGGVLSWAAGPGISRTEAISQPDLFPDGGFVVGVRCANADWVRRAELVLAARKPSRNAAAAC